MLRKLQSSSKHISANLKFVFIGTDAHASYNFRSTLIKKLTEQGHEVILIANGSFEHAIQGFTLIESPLSRGSLNPLKTFIETIKLTKLLKSLKPDVVFSFFVKPVIFGTIASKLAKIPKRIGMLEGLGYFFTKRPEKDSFKTRIVRCGLIALYKVSLPLLNKLIVLNNDDYEEIKQIVPHQQILILGGIGVPLDQFDYHFDPDLPLCFLFVGRMLFDKGIREFVQASLLLKAKYPYVTFKIVGDIDPSNPASLTEDDKEQLQNQITLQGFVHDIRPELKLASVVVLPSYREGVPMSLQEAMSMGKPVIATYVPGCKDLIDGNGYYVKPFDALDLANKMEAFILEPQKIESMGLQSLKRAQKFYCRDKKDQSLIKLLI